LLGILLASLDEEEAGEREQGSFEGLGYRWKEVQAVGRKASSARWEVKNHSLMGGRLSHVISSFGIEESVYEAVCAELIYMLYTYIYIYISQNRRTR